ncbi:hypothetical protein JI739_02220 [Ramlibacter sp. AW1]|uniref:Uncharacterized protein n=1 Tax=Ramlibacter aurantiacus TaxID=2801330 RepID=A0A937D4R4_9BURK|nr:hypothetical protein [Ramlibacter aurantiacus]MBL0419153.1 hypothetical protein [Ramlibacter aurantiacus]
MATVSGPGPVRGQPFPPGADPGRADRALSAQARQPGLPAPRSPLAGTGTLASADLALTKDALLSGAADPVE